MEQHELFDKHLPQILDAEDVNAAMSDGEVVSLTARRGLTDVFVVKFATDARVFRSIVLNRYSAEQLHQLLAKSGF